jgi:hypothetical protein
VLLEAANDRLHFLDRQIDVALDPATVLVLLEDLLERLLRQIEHHAAVHLHETPIRVPGEPRISALTSQSFHRHVVETEV